MTSDFFITFIIAVFQQLLKIKTAESTALRHFSLHYFTVIVQVAFLPDFKTTVIVDFPFFFPIILY